MSKKGRPSKYNNQETSDKLKDLVFLYRKENPSGIIRISNMVRFSKEMNRQNSLIFPTYDKDVWGTYGREFIDDANTPIRSVYKNDEDEIFEIPNITDIVEKFYHNKGTLLSYLLPIEKMIHDSLERGSGKTEKIKILEEINETLQLKLKEQEEKNRSYEEFILQMTHHSYIKEYQVKFGLENLVSVNANERNKEAMRNIDDLSKNFPESFGKDEAKVNETENIFLNKWKENRQKQR